jgi:hypothetical protein
LQHHIAGFLPRKLGLVPLCLEPQLRRAPFFPRGLERALLARFSFGPQALLARFSFGPQALLALLARELAFLAPSIHLRQLRGEIRLRRRGDDRRRERRRRADRRRDGWRGNDRRRRLRFYVVRERPTFPREKVPFLRPWRPRNEAVFPIDRDRLVLAAAIARDDLPPIGERGARECLGASLGFP